MEFLHKEVTEQIIGAGIEVFRQLGAETSEVAIPRAPYAIPIYYVVANADEVPFRGNRTYEF